MKLTLLSVYIQQSNETDEGKHDEAVTSTDIDSDPKR